MEDYPHLGVLNMDDRARLYRLVQLVKTLDEEDHGDDDGGDGGGGDGGRTPTRRQLDFSGEPPRSQPRHGRAGTGVRLRDNHADGISRVIGRPTDRAPQTRETARSQSTRVSPGYNYGLPLSSPVTNRK